METYILEFDIYEHDRRELELKFTGATYENFADFEQKTGLHKEQLISISEYVDTLNDEYYPTDSWFCFVRIKK